MKNMVSEELKVLKSIESKLNELVKWTKFAGIQQLRTILTQNLKNDTEMLIYELSDGGLAFIHSSWTEKSGYMYFEIHGDEGYIHIDSRWSKAIIKYGKSSDEPTCEDYTQYPKMSYDLELEDFVRDYREGFHPKPTSYDGYRAVKIIMQSYLTATRGSPMITFDVSDRELEKAFLKRFSVRDAYIRPQQV